MKMAWALEHELRDLLISELSRLAVILGSLVLVVQKLEQIARSAIRALEVMKAIIPTSTRPVGP